MNLIKEFEKKYAKKSIPSLKSGDIIRVHEKIKEGKKERIQIFEGIVLKTHGGKNLNATFNVRKISLGIGVEKIFPLHMPTIIKIETIKKIKNKKSRLYYLRKLTDKQIQKKGELKEYVVWNDAKAEKETEEFKKKKEAEAEKKSKEKAKEKEELNNKFAQIRGKDSKESIDSKKIKDSEKSKEGENNDKKEQKSGK